MKLFLASFLQKENFGPGDIIGICNDKPRDFEVKKQFKYFIPPQDLINTYYNLLTTDKEFAAEIFVSGYQTHLDKVTAEIIVEAEKMNVSPCQVLPFNDGDTLCSWERKQNTNYRKILAPYLERLGYDVVLN